MRTTLAALAGQCSVQCRSDQRRPNPAQLQYSGNPWVFRSPGPYLMSLSKKRFSLLSLTLSFLSLCFSLCHSPPFFSLMPPIPGLCPSPGATLRMNGSQVFTQQLCLFPSPSVLHWISFNREKKNLCPSTKHDECKYSCKRSILLFSCLLFLIAYKSVFIYYLHLSSRDFGKIINTNWQCGLQEGLKNF